MLAKLAGESYSREIVLFCIRVCVIRTAYVNCLRKNFAPRKRSHLIYHSLSFAISVLLISHCNFLGQVYYAFNS